MLRSDGIRAQNDSLHSSQVGDGTPFGVFDSEFPQPRLVLRIAEIDGAERIDRKERHAELLQNIVHKKGRGRVFPVTARDVQLTEQEESVLFPSLHQGGEHQVRSAVDNGIERTV